MIREVINYTDGEFTYTFPPIEDTILRKQVNGTYEVRYLTREVNPISPEEWEDLDRVLLVNYHRDFYVTRDNIITKQQVKDWYRGKKIPQVNEYYIFALSCLVHSGVWLSLSHSFPSDPGGWDTSHVGVVLVSKEQAKSRKKARKLAQGLIETWNKYLMGDVYTLVKQVYDTNKEQIDCKAVGGYYGIDYAKQCLETDV